MHIVYTVRNENQLQNIVFKSNNKNTIKHRDINSWLDEEDKNKLHAVTSLIFSN